MIYLGERVRANEQTGVKMDGTINRRSFLKMMGWGGVGTALSGCDLPTTVTLEEGKEQVVSYLMPEEYVIPGVGVWYASTCAQCAAGCGIHGRVREGRVLKLEGNPDSPMNSGKLCMMGQAGVQGQYNPDRVTQPMLRENGQLTPVSWEKALSTIKDKLGATSGDRVAWVSGTVSGHQAALLNSYLAAIGGGKHYAYELINNNVGQAVNRDMFGEAMPRLRIDKAKMILSFGADFLGTWVSPVHFAGEYAKFRSAKQRGLLVQVESKMSLTGGNADLWLAAAPHSEAQLALAIANVLIAEHGKDAAALPESVQAAIKGQNLDAVAKASGVKVERIKRIAQLLAERSPSLVLAGAPVEGQANGYGAVAAVMMLNVLLGNVGQTIESAGDFPFQQLQAKTGSTANLLAFAEAAKAKKIDVAFISSANPIYNAPTSLDMKSAFASIGLKVAIAQFPDETTAQADLLLPLSSYLEDWGTHVASYQSAQSAISMQQPLMEKLYAETRGLGDILVGLLKAAGKSEFDQYDDYYAYLRHAHDALPANYKTAATNEASWNFALQKGVIQVATAAKTLTSKVVDAVGANADAMVAGELMLVPTPRLGLWDGRHANLPWLQEAPDQISKVVWDSWAELHPSTADALGIKHGSIIKVSSEHGELTLKAVLIKSIHPQAIAIPMGQGHDAYGRFASGLGVNPLTILNPVTDSKTGELAMYATRVKVVATKDKEKVVRMGGNDTQMGRKLVVTISAEQLRRTEGA